MPKPGENKTVQQRIIKYAQDIGWEFVTRSEAEKARGFDKTKDKPKEQAASASLYFKELLYRKVREFNPNYGESQEVLLKQLDSLSTDIYGNKDFLVYLQNKGKYFYAAENRELDLKLIDYDDLSNNKYHVTEEYYITNGKYSNREDIVFLINGIPILVIECKNANKDEAIALTTELKKALMQKLFTEGTRNEPQKQTEIGLIPESWDVVKLNSLLREKLRNGHSAKETNDENGVRTLTLTAVTKNNFSETNTKITCADKEKTKKLYSNNRQ